jgi:hypothetical protein
MPANTGTPPEYELVDLQYRNGHTVRGIDPLKRRWSIADAKFGGESDFDIVRWQPAGPARTTPNIQGEAA